MRALSIGTWTCSLWLLAGCLGTSTGNPADAKRDPDDQIEPESPNTSDPTEGDGVTGGFCQGGPVSALAVDERSELGFSAADILAFAAGEHREVVRWNPLRDAAYGPEHGQGSIQVSVTAAGDVRYVGPPNIASEGSDGAGDGLLGGAEIDIAHGGCSGYLEIPVQLTLKTGGGALDEHMQATLRARSELAAELFAHPKPDMLGGALTVEETADGFRLGQLDLSIQFTPFGMSGTLSGVLERRLGSGVTSGVTAAATGDRPLAEWGLGACFRRGYPLGLADAVAGVRPQDLLDALAAIETSQVTWKPDGETSAVTVAFAPAADGACFSLPEYEAGLEVSVAGRLSLRSADGRLDADWPGAFVVQVGEGGVPDHATFVLDEQPFQQDASPAALATRYGFVMVSVEGFDFLRADIGVSVTLGKQARLSGSLMLFGHVLAECARQPADGAAAEDADAQAQADEASDELPDFATGGAGGSEDPGAGSAGASGSEGSSGGAASGGSQGTPGCIGSTASELVVGSLG